MRPRKNFDAAVTMYEQGSSIEQVAAVFEITRQAMWVILKRRGVVFRLRVRLGAENTFFRHGRGYNVEQRRAVVRVSKAVRTGKLVPQSCETCGSDEKCRDGRRKVHAHHDDYSKPLDVRWLCKLCHHQWHAR